jgi:hypothetical protein
VLGAQVVPRDPGHAPYRVDQRDGDQREPAQLLLRLGYFTLFGDRVGTCSPWSATTSSRPRRWRRRTETLPVASGGHTVGDAG